MSLAGYADIFLRNMLAVRRGPADLRIMGPCAGGAVYSPAITDFVLMVEGTSYMFVTGPDVVKTVTARGGRRSRSSAARRRTTQVSGVAHFVAPDEQTCLELIRELLSFLPQNNPEDPPYVGTTDDPLTARTRELDTLIPTSPNKPYDMQGRDPAGRRRRRLPRGARALRGEHRLSASRASTAARSASSRNQPRSSPACSTSTRREKAARFVRFCDASTSRSSRSSTCPASCPGRRRSTAGSSATARSCSTRTPRRPCRSSP